MKLVFDTNVLLSGVFTHGICETLLDACLIGGEHSVVLSEHILREFIHHAEDKFGAPDRQVQAAARLLRSQTELVKPAKVPRDACRDPDDLPVLGTALAAKAECVVTGDKDLLAIGTFEGIRILSPRLFHEMLR